MASGEQIKGPDAKEEDKVHILLWKLVKMLEKEIVNNRGDQFTANSDSVRKLESSMKSKRPEIRKMSVILLSKIVANDTVEYLIDHGLSPTDGKVMINPPWMIEKQIRGQYLGLLMKVKSFSRAQKRPDPRTVFYYAEVGRGEVEEGPLEVKSFNLESLKNLLKRSDFSEIPDPKRAIIWIEHSQTIGKKRITDESTKTHFSVAKKSSDGDFDDKPGENEKAKASHRIKMLPINAVQIRPKSRDRSNLRATTKTYKSPPLLPNNYYTLEPSKTYSHHQNRHQKGSAKSRHTNSPEKMITKSKYGDLKSMSIEQRIRDRRAKYHKITEKSKNSRGRSKNNSLNNSMGVPGMVSIEHQKNPIQATSQFVSTSSHRVPQKYNLSNLYKRSTVGSRSPNFRTRKYEGKFERRKSIVRDAKTKQKRSVSDSVSKKNGIIASKNRKRNSRNFFVKRHTSPKRSKFKGDGILGRSADIGLRGRNRLEKGIRRSRVLYDDSANLSGSQLERSQIVGGDGLGNSSSIRMNILDTESKAARHKGLTFSSISTSKKLKSKNNSINHEPLQISLEPNQMHEEQLLG